VGGAAFADVGQTVGYGLGGAVWQMGVSWGHSVWKWKRRRCEETVGDMIE